MNSLPRINSEEIGQLCQSVLQDFDSVMTCTVISNLIIDKPLENGSENEVSKSSESSEDCISRALMIQLIAMAIMSVTRLKVEGMHLFADNHILFFPLISTDVLE